MRLLIDKSKVEKYLVGSIVFMLILYVLTFVVGIISLVISHLSKTKEAFDVDYVNQVVVRQVADKLVYVNDEDESLFYAVKNFINAHKAKGVDNNQVNYMSRAFLNASKIYNVPISILLAVAWQESHFNPFVKSKAGCIGIMQVNPKVWNFGIEPKLLYLPDFNIYAGAYILNYYYQQTKSWNEAIYRYYGISDFGKKYLTNVLNRKSKVEKFLREI
jgi:hypothetical protein